MVYEDLHGASGSLVARGGRAVITVDRSAPREEQRLAVAHELAHWLLGRGESGFVPKCLPGTKDLHWDAPVTFDTVWDLARLFRTTH